jgi:hypothetical protein
MAYGSKEKGARGQKVVRPTGRDDSSFKVKDKEARDGKSMGGSTKNLGHTISGASANQKHK